MTEPTPPAYLTPASQSLWRSITGRYQLQDEHLAQLRLALQALDRADESRETLDREGLVVTGARGVPQRHPLVDVEAQSRSAALRAFRQLGLAEYSEEPKQRRDGHGRWVTR